MVQRKPFPGLERGRYQVILADPPWTFKTYSAKGTGRLACRHYGVLSLGDIKAMPVGDLAADDCALFVWCIDCMLPEALAVITAWGFTYKTVGFTWAKTNAKSPGYFTGMGYWTRANPESCLFATRGSPKRLNKNVRQLIVAPRGRHSAKPPELRDRIMRLVGGPYCELFARERTAGWDSWGNELQPVKESVMLMTKTEAMAVCHVRNEGVLTLPPYEGDGEVGSMNSPFAPVIVWASRPNVPCVKCRSISNAETE
jgi:N6-adenosine-specific RNA methylase IME4